MTVDATRQRLSITNLITLCLVLSGCWQFDPLETAHMSELERTSYVAVGRDLNWPLF